MVGPLTVLKMMHCRKLCRATKNRTTPANVQPTQNINVKKEYIKREIYNDLCRICLKQGTIPIFKDDPSEDLADAISTFGGIDLSIFDSHPKYLCHSCHELLQAAILFKKTAQETDEQLRKSLRKVKTEIDNHFNNSQENADESSLVVKQKTVIKCVRCKIVFNTTQELEEHKLTEEHETQRKTCKICSKNFALSYFKRHMEKHNNVVSYICDVCGKHFILQNQFVRHRMTHFYEFPFQCSHCPYKGRFPESLKMHMKLHTGEKAYICAECPQRFVNKSNLNRHMLTHKKRDFPCECGRGFYTKKELDVHYKVHHVGIKEHICSICGKAFGYRNKMMKHQLKVHKRAKMKNGRMPIYLKVQKMQQQDNNTSSS